MFKIIKTLKNITMTISNDLPTTFSIDDLETLKIIADPLRGQIFEALILQPLTVKQIAKKLNVAATKLYYHVKLLEKIGLIQVIDTQLVSGILEKHYRATAQRLKFDPNLLTTASNSSKDDINTVLLATIDTTREDIARSLKAHYSELDQDTRCIMISRQLSRFSDERADEFCQRLEELIKEFSDADAKSNKMQTFALTIAFYPSYHFQLQDTNGITDSNN